MRRISLFMAMISVPFLPLSGQAAMKSAKPPVIAPRPVERIDSLIATEVAGRITIQAKGAVGSGGWRGAMLKPVKSGSGDQHTIVLQFVATPPSPSRAVIMGLLPVGASTTMPMRRGIVSVRAISGSNEITTQILR
jgi:hypothetical protein